LAEREKHGALIDTRLLARVYLELQGGKDRALDFTSTTTAVDPHGDLRKTVYGARPRPLQSRLSGAERAEHERFVAGLKGDVIWRRFGSAYSSNSPGNSPG
jgi:DNA polymerase-3 subunit epsilon